MQDKIVLFCHGIKYIYYLKYFSEHLNILRLLMIFEQATSHFYIIYLHAH